MTDYRGEYILRVYLFINNSFIIYFVFVDCLLIFCHFEYLPYIGACRLAGPYFFDNYYTKVLTMC